MGILDTLNKAATGILPARTSATSASNTAVVTGINRSGLVGFNALEIYPAQNPALLRYGYMENHYVFTVADWKASRSAEAPPLLYRVKSKKHLQQYRQLFGKKGMEVQALVARIKALEEIDEHPLLKVLRNPNPAQTWRELDYALNVYWDFGNSLLYGVRLTAGMNKGQVREIYVLPNTLYVGETPTTAGYLNYVHSTDSSIRIPGTDVLHLRRFNPDPLGIGGGLWGMSKLYPARRLLTKANQAIEAEAEMFQNRSARTIIFPKGVSYADMATIGFDGAKATEDIRKKLKQAGSGGIAGNSVELGSITLGLSPVDLDILESNKVSKEELCHLWHLHPRSVFPISDGSSMGGNQEEEANKHSIRAGVLPDLRLKAEKLTSWLCPAYGDDLFIDFDTDVYPEMRLDGKEIAEYVDSIPLTGDERRALFKWGETGKPEMQVELIKNNLMAVSDFLIQPDESQDEVENDGSYGK
ncbi:hypothetical protein GCM10028807_58050 [Spirosoma daeguense]